MHTFLTALMFFTRIPVPATLPYSKELLNKALRFFPLVGGIVGGIGAGSLWLGLLVFPFPLALLLSMLVTIFVTGAFHEDGFADFCDGYGAAHQRKGAGNHEGQSIGDLRHHWTDSHAGHQIYGIKLFIRAPYFSGHDNCPYHQPLCPRAVGLHHPLHSEDALSKAKPIGNQTTRTSVAIALVTALVPLLFFDWPSMVGMLVASALILWLFRATS